MDEPEITTSTTRLKAQDGPVLNIEDAEQNWTRAAEQQRIQAPVRPPV
jgi:hypothetical protein